MTVHGGIFYIDKKKLSGGNGILNHIFGGDTPFVDCFCNILANNSTL